ncbi:MAG: hypothetical protein Q7S42_01355 [Candidatus Omnitrophota bacterium]|nr:hypothetical protein [Candidatus Omnitrophota bacterium]
MNFPLAAQHGYQILENEDEGLCSFILWASGRLWYWYWQHYVVNTLAAIGVISIYFFIIKLYRHNKALNLRLGKIEKEINKG